MRSWCDAYRPILTEGRQAKAIPLSHRVEIGIANSDTNNRLGWMDGGMDGLAIGKYLGTEIPANLQPKPHGMVYEAHVKLQPRFGLSRGGLPPAVFIS